MSVLSRVNFVAQQRVDVHHALMQESFTAFDFRSMVTQLVGTDKQYVGRGFEVIGRTGLTIQIKVANSQVFNPADNNGSFYVGLSTDAPISLELPASQPNVYVEGRFVNVTQAPVDTAFWDPLALTGADNSGSEFSASANSQSILILVFTANTVGFSPGAIPIMYAKTGTNSIDTMQDRRPLLYRLGTGGASPDPSHKYAWSNVRQEPVPGGVGVGDAVDSPWRARDAVGSLNDKAFGSFKEWADAVMTQISDITGSSLWYVNGLTNAPVANISLNEVFFDTLGSNLQAIGHSSAFKWKRVSGNLCLCGEGNVVQTGAPLSAHEGLIRWQSNYSKLEWQLGATFTSATSRNYSEVKFQAPAPDDKGNTYLLLEREVAKGSGASVNWGSNAGAGGGTFAPTKSISGQAGDFTGIALGDWVRKMSEGYARYYRVAKMSDGITPYSSLVVDDQNHVADASITILELEDTIASGASFEPLRYFRARYSNADLFSDQNIATNGYIYQSADFWWLGRRYGELFYLREFGYMQEGDEVDAGRPEVDGIGIGGSGTTDLTIQHAKGAIFNSVAYDLRAGATGDLLTIYRRSRDNTVDTPSSGDNSGALLTYTLAGPITFSGDQFLWARLSNTTSGALTAGSVTNSTDDLDNTDTLTNVYEVRDALDTPLRTGDNQDIVLLARSVGGVLIFFDGTRLNLYGRYLDSHVQISGDLRIDGNLEVYGTSVIAQTEIVQSNDKIIDLGVGTLNLASADSGIQVADNTQQTTSATSSAGVAGTGYIDLTVTGHGFANTAGQTIGVSSNKRVGGVTPGDMSNDYISIAFPGAGAAGKIQVVDADTLRIFPVVDVPTSSTSALSPPTTQIRVFDLLSWIKMTAADGTSGMTSWGFRVKGLTQDVTLTPVTAYGTIATSHSVNMQAQRIPFVNNDNAGPAGADSTLNYSAALAWDGTNLNVDGNIIPQQDNTWDLGSTTLRWKTLHVGPGSVVVHNDTTNTAWVKLLFSGAYAQVATDASTKLQLVEGSTIVFHTYGTGNVFAGSGAGNLTTTGINNSVLGYQALVSNTGGANNSVLGYQALVSNTDGSYNISLGQQSLFSNTTGNYNTAIGAQTLYTNNGDENVAVGSYAMPNHTGGFGIGYGNVAIGTQALANSTTATKNTVIGYGSGSGLTTGGNNTILGALVTGLTSSLTANIILANGNGGAAAIKAQHDATNWNLTGSLIPTANNSYDLGTTSLRWRNIYATGSLNVQFGATRTANYTILTTDCVVPINTTGGAFTVTLPASTASNKGQMVVVKDVGGFIVFTGKALTIAPNGTDTIDGTNASIVMNFAQQTSISLVSDGAGGWIII